MGNIYIPFKALFQRLNIDLVIPPVNNQRTLSLGVRYSPEGLCIPFKLTLGKLGVEVRRTTFVSEWTKFSLFLNPLGMDEKDRIHKAAWPYLKRDIGGDGWESVGEKVLHAKKYDGLVHLAPFTCMPETIAQNIMPSTKETIPVLTILCDEQLAKPGMLTRLEAFVDLLERKRRTSNNN